MLVVAALALAAWAGYRFALRDHIRPRNFGTVTDGHVYRSAALTPAALKRVHTRHGVRTLIDLGGFDRDPAGARVQARTAEALGIRRVVLPLEGDGTGNPNAYVAALRLLADPAAHPVLVHCASGAQRTGACVILYRHILQGQAIAEAYPEAFAYGHDPGDNWKLMAYLADWAGPIARAVRERGWVEGFPPVSEDEHLAGATPERRAAEASTAR